MIERLTRLSIAFLLALALAGAGPAHAKDEAEAEADRLSGEIEKLASRQVWKLRHCRSPGIARRTRT